MGLLRMRAFEVEDDGLALLRRDGSIAEGTFVKMADPRSQVLSLAAEGVASD